jgi:hypothetical protein
MESSKTQNQTASIVQDCNNISHKLEKSSIGDRFIVRNLWLFCKRPMHWMQRLSRNSPHPISLRPPEE